MDMILFPDPWLFLFREKSNPVIHAEIYIFAFLNDCWVCPEKCMHMKIEEFFKRRKVALVGVMVITISLFILAFSESNDFKLVKNIEIYTSLFRELNLYYVDETDPEKLIKSSIDEMLKTLDPYTVYIPESEMEDFQFVTTGEYGGIGSLIRKSGDYAVISEVYRNFPADLANFKTGDLIIEIDGKSTKSLTVTKISELLKGAPETQLKITVQRPGTDQLISKILVRKRIQIKSVPYYGVLPNDIGYIRLTSFTMGAGTEVTDALSSLKQNHDLKGLVLDLRGNPGGLLMEAVSVTNLFVAKGNEIVSTRGKVREYDHSYYATDTPTDTIIPIAVLVNRNSASSSEIVAGAIQDLDRGIIVGERTYGKGLVQTARPLSYNSQLKVTTAKYYIPSGRCIQALDYSNRNEDGSVGHIPDSLISEYTTQNGRKVYDGGGITPDVQINPGELSQIAVELYTRFLVFDYATRYSTQHDTIAPPDRFAITDEEYKEFIHFIDSNNFDYRTQTEDALKKLENLAKREKYFERSKEEFHQLQEKLSHNKYKDLETFRSEIQEFLEEEIVGRYYYQDGRIQSSLSYDEQLTGAIEVLKDQDQYSSILQIKSPGIVAEKK
jgi:carboxyl-terminal processing protease